MFKYLVFYQNYRARKKVIFLQKQVFILLAVLIPVTLVKGLIVIIGGQEKFCRTC